MYALIPEYSHFPKMRTHIKRYIAQCIECILSMLPRGRVAGELHPTEPGNRPIALVPDEHVGSFAISKRGSRDVLTIMDRLTKFMEMKPRNTKTIVRKI